MKNKRMIAIFMLLVLCFGYIADFTAYASGITTIDYFYWVGEYPNGDPIKKPTAKFSIQTINGATNTAYGSTIVSDSGVERKVIVGDKVKIIDQSTVGAGNKLESWDFQYWSKSVASAQYLPNKPDREIEINADGTWQFFLNVRDNKTVEQQNKGMYYNFSSNGTRRVLDKRKEVSHKEWWWWYFTTVKVIAEYAEVQVKHINIDTGEELSKAEINKTLKAGKYTYSSRDIVDYKFVKSAIGYTESELNASASKNEEIATREVVLGGDKSKAYVTFYYKDNKNTLDVEFDVLRGTQNITSQIDAGTTIKIDRFPFTLNFNDKSVSKLGTVSFWNWQYFNYTSNSLESFSRQGNSSIYFKDEEVFRQYTSNNRMVVRLDATDTLGESGSKARTINFDLPNGIPDVPGAKIKISGTATRANIPFGGTWGETIANFNIEAINLSPGEEVVKWHTSYKSPRTPNSGYASRQEHEDNGKITTRRVITEVSQNSNQVWLKAELTTNRGTYVAEGYVTAPVNQQGQPPVAIINAPDIVYMGDIVTLDGTKSYSPDPNKLIEAGWWYLHPSVEVLTKNQNGFIDRTQTRLEVIFNNTGEHTIELDVWDNSSVRSIWPDTHTVTVLEPHPKAVITLFGKLKENRKISLDSLGSSGSERYPVVESKTKWTITPLEGQSVGNIKLDGSLTSVRFDTLFRQPGKYKIELYVENTLGNSDIAEKIVDIQPDVAPIANFSTINTIYRDPESGNKATITLYDNSYTLDSDYIVKRIWKYAYDSNNNGSFADEIWKVLDDTNKETVQLVVDPSNIGKYKFELEVQEEFGQETIDKFVTSADRRKGNTDSKPTEEKIVNVDNVAPRTSFFSMKKRKADVVVNVANTKHNNILAINTEINNSLIPILESNGVDANINVINNTPSNFTKLLVKATNEQTRKLLLYDYSNGTLQESSIPNPYSGYGNKLNVLNLGMASNGKFYYFRPTTNILNNNMFKRFSVVEYDSNLKIENIIYESGQHSDSLNRFLVDIGRTTEFLGKYTGDAYISHDDSMYFFELKLHNAIPQQQTYGYSTTELIRLNLKTGAYQNIYSYAQPRNQWGHQGEIDLRIVGTDRHGNLLLVEGLSLEGLTGGVFNNYPPQLTHRLKIIRPDGTNITLANHHIIKDVQMNKNGEVIYSYVTWERKQYGYNYVWESTTTYRKLNLNSSGSIQSFEILNNEPFAGLSFLKFKPSDQDKLILTDISKNEYEYSISTKTKNPNYINFANYNSLFHFQIYGNKKITSMYNPLIRQYEGYLFDYNTKEANKLTGLAKENLLSFLPVVNIPGGYDEWDNYRPPRTVEPYIETIHPYIINEYPTTQIRMPESLDKALEQVEWRENTERFFINIADATISELNDPKKLSSIIMNALGSQADIVGLGTSTNQAQYTSLKNQLDGNGTFINNSNLSTAMTNLGNYIVAKKEKEEVDRYVLIDEELDYFTQYEDKEGDPKIVERWRYVHNPNFFESPMGTISQSGEYISSPIKVLGKTGQFDITFQARDNPVGAKVGFDEYKKWSNGDLSTITYYAHRRPIANFSYSLVYNPGPKTFTISLNGQGYDLDHISKFDKGIVEEEWKWKELSSPTWTLGKPTTLQESKTYLIMYRVKDREGVWSYPEVKELDTMNIPPTITANPIRTDGWYNKQQAQTSGDLRVQVIANAFNGKTISQVRYSWSRSITTPGTWTTTNQSTFPLTQPTDGIWYLHLISRDSGGLESDHVVVGPYLVDKTPPTDPTIINNQNWTNADSVPVSITSGTDATSGVARVEYRLTGATTLIWTTYTGGFEITNPSITNIFARTVDIAGNPSNESISVVRIDRIVPNADADIKNYEGFEIPNVKIIATDTGGSGLKEVRYRWTNTIAKPLTGWTTTTQSSINTAPSDEGIWYLHMEATDNAGNSFYRYRGPYQIVYLNITATLQPNPAMAGERIHFTANTEGAAERVTVYLWNGDRVTLTPQKTPARDNAKNTWTGNYIVPLKTEERRYTNIRAVAEKDSKTAEAPLELTIKGNIYNLVKPRIRNSN